MLCSCGIRCWQWTSEVFMCPRCRSLMRMTSEGILMVKGERADFLIQTIEGDINGAMLKHREMFALTEAVAPPLRKTTAIPSQPKEARKHRPEAPCLMCGHAFEDKCGAVCPKCGWIRPCAVSG